MGSGVRVYLVNMMLRAHVNFAQDNDDDTHDHLSGSALQLSHRSEATSYMQYKPCVVKGISLSRNTDCFRAGSGRPLIIAAIGLDCQGTSRDALSSSLCPSLHIQIPSPVHDTNLTSSLESL